MAKRLEVLGGIVTCCYLLVIACFVMTRFSEFTALKLNELGDFLAGSFGPIAFLWLVLGFLQQGRELKLSTDALNLQAQELKNSVEQQSIMADAALRQIDSARQALDLQMQDAERAVSADFEVRQYIKSRKDGYVAIKLKVANNRNIAYGVTSEFRGDLPFHDRSDHGTMKAGIELELEVLFPPGSRCSGGEFLIMYEDVNSVSRIDAFRVDITTDDSIKIEKLRNKSSRVIPV
ncbi:hypothetical protein [Pseudomonas syringae]